MTRQGLFMNFFISTAIIGSIVFTLSILTSEKQSLSFLEKEKTESGINQYKTKNDLLKRVRDSEKEIDYWNTKLDELSKERKKVSTN